MLIGMQKQLAYNNVKFTMSGSNQRFEQYIPKWGANQLMTLMRIDTNTKFIKQGHLKGY